MYIIYDDNLMINEDTWFDIEGDDRRILLKATNFWSIFDVDLKIFDTFNNVIVYESSEYSYGGILKVMTPLGKLYIERGYIDSYTDDGSWYPETDFDNFRVYLEN